MISRFFLNIVIVLFVTVQINAQVPSELSSEELLAKYEKSLVNFAKTVSFQAESEMTFSGDWNYNIIPNRRLKSFQVSRDIKKLDIVIETQDQHLEKLIDHQPMHDISRSIFADQFIYYKDPVQKPPSVLFIDSDLEERKNWGVGKMFLGSSLDGYSSYIHFGKTYPEIMRKSPSFKMRKEMEIIDGHETYVLESVPSNAHEKLILWIDPEYGFNPRRIVVSRPTEAFLKGKPYSAPVPAEKYRLIPCGVELLNELTVDSIKIEKVGDVFVPIEAKMKWHRKFANDEFTTIECTHTRKNVNFNPDFEAMGAFIMDVPNGTSVSFLDNRQHSGVQYEWRDGKVIPNVDETFLDLLDDEIDFIKNVAKSKATPQVFKMAENLDKKAVAPDGTSKSLPVSRGQNEPTTSFSIWLVPLVGLAIVAMVGVVLFARSRRSCDDKS
jgi:hypothetical protein